MLATTITFDATILLTGDGMLIIEKYTKASQLSIFYMIRVFIDSNFRTELSQWTHF